MEIGERFMAYAMAFEQTFADDDWSRLEQYFTPDAVYRTGAGEEIRGRTAVLAHLRSSLEAFDRRFDSRKVGLLAEPELTADSVTIEWRAVFRLAGAPEVVLSGTERAAFAGGAIARLEDTLADGVEEAVQRWTEEHGQRLPSRGTDA